MVFGEINLDTSNDVEKKFDFRKIEENENKKGNGKLKLIHINNEPFLVPSSNEEENVTEGDWKGEIRLAHQRNDISKSEPNLEVKVTDKEDESHHHGLEPQIKIKFRQSLFNDEINRIIDKNNLE